MNNSDGPLTREEYVKLLNELHSVNEAIDKIMISVEHISSFQNGIISSIDRLNKRLDDLESDGK